MGIRVLCTCCLDRMHFVILFPCLFAYLFIVVLGLNPWPPVCQASIYTIELHPQSGLLPPEGLLGRLLLCLAGLVSSLDPRLGLVALWRLGAPPLSLVGDSWLSCFSAL